MLRGTEHAVGSNGAGDQGHFPFFDAENDQFVSFDRNR